MKSVLLLLLGGLGLAAQAQELSATEAPQAQIAADASFVQQSQPAPVQLADVNEQEGATVVPSFVSEPQNQAMMLGGLLAVGFMVRRRRDH